MIIDITDTAKAELKNVIKRKKTDKPLRIFVAGYG
jgi:Fe-S cluster assembly iron-binding protein IscA